MKLTKRDIFCVLLIESIFIIVLTFYGMLSPMELATWIAIPLIISLIWSIYFEFRELSKVIL